MLSDRNFMYILSVCINNECTIEEIMATVSVNIIMQNFTKPRYPWDKVNFK
jgi:hypothetical protein